MTAPNLEPKDLPIDEETDSNTTLNVPTTHVATVSTKSSWKNQANVHQYSTLYHMKRKALIKSKSYVRVSKSYKKSSID